jgi:hypothetical protein
LIFDSYLAICLAHIQFYFTSNISFSEGFKLGPIKELLPDISYGKIKLALAQMEKSTGQVIGEVRIFFRQWQFSMKLHRSILFCFCALMHICSTSNQPSTLEVSGEGREASQESLSNAFMKLSTTIKRKN